MIKTPIECLSEKSNIEISYLELGDEVQLIRPSEAIEAIEAYHNQFESKWISIEDKPTPDFDGEYLCVVLESEECGQTYFRQRVMQCLFNIWVVKFNQSVIAWMKLPPMSFSVPPNPTT